MMETAPVMVPPRPAGYCCLSPDEPLVYNPYGWTNATAMLYIEQPVGVGYSYGGPDPENEDDVSGDVYAFLVNFYEVFRDTMLPKKLYIVGESYAGYYVPSIAHKIHSENKKYRRGDRDGRIHIRLGGTSIARQHAMNRMSISQYLTT